MPTQSEYNQFRRYIGDYGVEAVDDSDIDSYLDDATRELTSDFTVQQGNDLIPNVITSFDVLVGVYHPEVIIKAAINFWWDRAAKLADKHSQTVGQSSQNVSEKWDRAMQMIQQLEVLYADIQTLGTHMVFGNLSRFSKATLTRVGGVREEVELDGPTS